MAYDLMQGSGRERFRIDVARIWEVRWWAQAIGISEQELREAIAEVGNDVDQVRRHLRNRKSAHVPLEAFGTPEFSLRL
ncbi:MAG: DUF3606 domain-containing protein [Betaproteobacteria bacterium]